MYLKSIKTKNKTSLIERLLDILQIFLFFCLLNMYLKSIKSNMFIIYLNIFSLQKPYVTP